jgi:hypothetical protein
MLPGLRELFQRRSVLIFTENHALIASGSIAQPRSELTLIVRAGFRGVFPRFEGRRTNMSRPKNPGNTELEAGPGWITRAEARDLLGVGEIELRELTRGLNLSRRSIPLYSKAEILALRVVVKKLR